MSDIQLRKLLALTSDSDPIVRKESREAIQEEFAILHDQIRDLAVRLAALENRPVVAEYTV